jgi:type IV fimbrial biogenesis protein FimT
MEGRAGGATLAEMLVVLGILSVLTVASFPVFDTSGSEARQFTLVMMRSLALARRQAVGAGERVTLCGSLDGVACERDWRGRVGILVFTDRDRDRRLDAAEPLHHHQRLLLHQGKVFWRGSAGRAYIRFRADGSAVDFGRYTYCPLSGEADQFRQLVVNRAGRAYQHHDGAGKRKDCD